MDKQKEDLNAQHNIFFKKFNETVDAHEDKFSGHNKKIRGNTELLDLHSKDLEFLKAFRIDTGNRLERLDKTVKKNLANAQDDTNKLRDELTTKIDDIEKTQMENFESLQLKINETKSNLKADLNSLRDDLTAKQNEEVNKLKDYVITATEKVNTNNGDIYEQYDEKLKKIKDVCAQYFSKYEKHLINHQTIVKDLERQQEQWV